MNINRDYDSWRGILSWNRESLREEMKCSLNSNVSSRIVHEHRQILAKGPQLPPPSVLATAVTTGRSQPDDSLYQIKTP